MKDHSTRIKDSKWVKATLSIIQYAIKWTTIFGGVGVLVVFYKTATDNTIKDCGCAAPELPMRLARINDAQQRYFNDNHKFAHSFTGIQSSILQESFQYYYQIVTATNTLTIATATARLETERSSYTSALYKVDTGEMQTLVCMTEQASTMPPILEWKEDRLVCPPDSRDVKLAAW